MATSINNPTKLGFIRELIDRPTTYDPAGHRVRGSVGGLTRREKTDIRRVSTRREKTDIRRVSTGREKTDIRVYVEYLCVNFNGYEMLLLIIYVDDI